MQIKVNEKTIGEFASNEFKPSDLFDELDIESMIENKVLKESKYIIMRFVEELQPMISAKKPEILKFVSEGEDPEKNDSYFEIDIFQTLLFEYTLASLTLKTKDEAIEFAKSIGLKADEFKNKLISDIEDMD